MTLSGLASAHGIDHQDFLSRVDTLRPLGKTVLISSFGRYFRLVEYLSRYTQKMIGIALSIAGLQHITDDQQYTDLSGGVLESVGRLFKHNVKLYVYPTADPVSGTPITLDTLVVAPQLQHLLAYLLDNRRLEAMRTSDPRLLAIHADDVLARMRSGDASWEGMVPAVIADSIKRERLFGWQPTPVGGRGTDDRVQGRPGRTRSGS
jgi:hypothetical protein